MRRRPLGGVDERRGERSVDAIERPVRRPPRRLAVDAQVDAGRRGQPTGRQSQGGAQPVQLAPTAVPGREQLAGGAGHRCGDRDRTDELDHPASAEGLTLLVVRLTRFAMQQREDTEEDEPTDQASDDTADRPVRPGQHRRRRNRDEHDHARHRSSAVRTPPAADDATQQEHRDYDHDDGDRLVGRAHDADDRLGHHTRGQPDSRLGDRQDRALPHVEHRSGQLACRQSSRGREHAQEARGRHVSIIAGSPGETARCGMIDL